MRFMYYNSQNKHILITLCHLPHINIGSHWPMYANCIYLFESTFALATHIHQSFHLSKPVVKIIFYMSLAYDTCKCHLHYIWSQITAKARTWAFYLFNKHHDTFDLLIILGGKYYLQTSIRFVRHVIIFFLSICFLLNTNQ